MGWLSSSRKAANVPLSPEMKQFQAANKPRWRHNLRRDEKAWRAKFADAEQANTWAGKANAARIAGEMRRVTDDMRIMAEKGNFTEWQKANDL